MPRFHLPNKLKHATLRLTPPAISLPRALASSGTKLRGMQPRIPDDGVTALPARARMPFAQLFQLLPLGAKPGVAALPGRLSSAAPAGLAQVGGFATGPAAERRRASLSALKLLQKPAARLARLTPTTAQDDEPLPHPEFGLGPRQSEVDALPGSKQGSGRFLYDRNGTPAWYEDAEGNLFGPNDPKLPGVVADILDAAQRTRPSNGFELWQMQNPEGTAEDYLGLAAAGKIKPLAEQLSDAERDGDSETANRIRRVLAQVRVKSLPPVSSFGRQHELVTLTPRRVR